LLANPNNNKTIHRSCQEKDSHGARLGLCNEVNCVYIHFIHYVLVVHTTADRVKNYMTGRGKALPGCEARNGIEEETSQKG
jgi:hypothetical protein